MSVENNSKQDLGNNKKEFKKIHLILICSSILAAGLFLRIYYLPFEIPITLDGLLFFWYANDVSLLGRLPLDYSPANNGWPIFLSFFFQIFNSNSFMDYMILQRLVTVILSILTIIPIYFLCRKFFSEKIALMGSAIFAFEPRIIQNSILGVTEPLFILLVSTSIVCFLNKQKWIIFLSIALISLASIVRSEGIILLIPFTIIYGIRFRKSKKIFYEIPLLILIFILIILPISVYRTDVTGSDTMLSRIPNIFTSTDSLENNNVLGNIENSQKFIEIKNIFTIIGWASIPFFIFLVPYGIYRIFKSKEIKNNTISTILIFLSIPAIYAISFLPDIRYLYVLYPLLCLISLFSIQKFISSFSRKNFGLIIIIGLILIGSISFLEIKKMDVRHEYEALKIAEIVVKETEKINQYTLESGYLPIIGMNELEEFPILRSEFASKSNDMKHCFNIHSCEYILSVKTDNIIEFLNNAEKQGITHLIIDDNEKRRAGFIENVFQNEDKFSYLTKIYDSKEENFSYHVKIFEIDFEKFNELNSEKKS